MNSPLDRLPEWASVLIKDQVAQAAEKIRPELVDDVRKRFDAVVADLPGTAAREMDRLLGTARTTFGRWASWLSQYASLSTSTVNASGILFHPKVDTLSSASGQSDGSLSFVASRQNTDLSTRIDRSLKSASIELSGHGANVATSIEAALIASLSTAKSGPIVIAHDGPIELPSGCDLAELLKDVSEVHHLHTSRVTIEDLQRLSSEHPSGYTLLTADAPGSIDNGCKLDGEARPASWIHLSLTASPRSLEEELSAPLPTFASIRQSGCDIAIIAANAMLGGPHAGLIIAKEDTLLTIRNSPRWHWLAANLDTCASVVMAMRSWIEKNESHDILIRSMLETTTANLHARAQRIRDRLQVDAGISEIAIVEMPAKLWADDHRRLPSVGLRMKHSDLSGHDWSQRLATGSPAVIVDSDDSFVIVDLRFVDPSCDALLGQRLGTGSDLESTTDETEVSVI